MFSKLTTPLLLTAALLATAGQAAPVQNEARGLRWGLAAASAHLPKATPRAIDDASLAKRDAAIGKLRWGKAAAGVNLPGVDTTKSS
jgi:hypothetical protein